MGMIKTNNLTTDRIESTLCVLIRTLEHKNGYIKV